LGALSFLFCIPKAIESGLAARRNAIGSSWAAGPKFSSKSCWKPNPKSLQHEYECFFESGVCPQNFEFFKKKWLQASFRGEIVVDEEQWDKNIGSGLITRSNALGFGVAARTNNR
jgi:hypothetical protein